MRKTRFIIDDSADKFLPILRNQNGQNVNIRPSTVIDRTTRFYSLQKLQKKSFSTSKISLVGIGNKFRPEPDHIFGNGSSLSGSSTMTKSRSSLLKNQQDIFDELDNAYQSSVEEKTNDNFVEDILPVSVPTDWIKRMDSEKDGARLEHSDRFTMKQSCILELLSTELNFLKQIQFVLNIESKVFTPIQCKYFPHVSTSEIFLSLGDIYEANYLFWNNYLYAPYKDYVVNQTTITMSLWTEGFQMMKNVFHPYHNYCTRMPACRKHIQSLEKENKHFARFSQWFSQLPAANRESLSDFIIKPFQRLTKYCLLLNAICNYSDDEKEQKELTEMVAHVKKFIQDLNQNISINRISMRLDPIELVEPPSDDSNDLSSLRRSFDLTSPVRTPNSVIPRDFVSHCNFRFKEAQTKSLDVTCLLFTDIILICQRVRDMENDRIKVIRPIIPLTKLVILSCSRDMMSLHVYDNYEILIAMYLLNGDNQEVFTWSKLVSEKQREIELLMNESTPVTNFVSPYLTNGGGHNSLLEPPSVNIVCSSPIDGRSASATPTRELSLSPQIPHRSILPVQASFNTAMDRNSPSNLSLMRSSKIHHSPVFRKRNNNSNMGSRSLRHESMTEQPHSGNDDNDLMESDEVPQRVKSHSCVLGEDRRPYSGGSLELQSHEHLASPPDQQQPRQQLDSMDTVSDSIAEEPEEALMASMQDTTLTNNNDEDEKDSNDITPRRSSLSNSQQPSTPPGKSDVGLNDSLKSSRAFYSMMDLSEN